MCRAAGQRRQLCVCVCARERLSGRTAIRECLSASVSGRASVEERWETDPGLALFLEGSGTERLEKVSERNAWRCSGDVLAILAAMTQNETLLPTCLLRI